jgi:predicted GIY-YIG superfamily endonuclease
VAKKTLKSEMMKKYKRWHVYVMICPNENIVRYIGITSKNPSVRFMQHVMGKGTATKGKKDWIQSLKNEGKLPIFKVIESGIQEEEARKKEIELIQEYKVKHPGKITNV